MSPISNEKNAKGNATPVAQKIGLSESSQNKTAHRDYLIVDSFLVRKELVRLVVLVEIVKLVRPAVEDFLGFLCRLTIEAQAVLLKGGANLANLRIVYRRVFLPVSLHGTKPFCRRCRAVALLI